MITKVPTSFMNENIKYKRLKTAKMDFDIWYLVPWLFAAHGEISQMMV
jgi:hypothetical protein